MCERVLPLSSCAGLIRWIPGVKGHAASVFRGQAWHDFLSYSIKATIETGHRHLSLLRVGNCSCILSSCSDAGMETFTVTLEGGSPWGFSIQGGVDHRSPLRVGKVCTPVNRHSIDQVSAAWDEKPRSTILKVLWKHLWWKKWAWDVIAINVPTCGVLFWLCQSLCGKVN